MSKSDVLRESASITLYPGVGEALVAFLDGWRPRAGFARRVLLRSGDAFRTQTLHDRMIRDWAAQLTGVVRGPSKRGRR